MPLVLQIIIPLWFSDSSTKLNWLNKSGDSSLFFFLIINSLIELRGNTGVLYKALNNEFIKEVFPTPDGPKIIKLHLFILWLL